LTGFDFRATAAAAWVADEDLRERIRIEDARARDAATGWEEREDAVHLGRALRLRLVDVLMERAASRSPRQAALGVGCFARASEMSNAQLDDLIAAVGAADLDDGRDGHGPAT
jgi:hypothetical protein